MALGDDWPELLTVKEAAKILRISPLTLKRWGNRGILIPLRINARGDRRYTKEQLLWFLGQKTESTNPSAFDTTVQQSPLI